MLVANLRRRGLAVAVVFRQCSSNTSALRETLSADHYYDGMTDAKMAVLLARLKRQRSHIVLVGTGFLGDLQEGMATVLIRKDDVDTADVVVKSSRLSSVAEIFSNVERFDRRSRIAKVLCTVPPCAAIAGALFLGTGVITSIMMNQVAFWSGVVTVVRLPGAKTDTTPDGKRIGKDGNDNTGMKKQTGGDGAGG